MDSYVRYLNYNLYCSDKVCDSYIRHNLAGLLEYIMDCIHKGLIVANKAAVIIAPEEEKSARYTVMSGVLVKEREVQYSNITEKLAFKLVKYDEKWFLSHTDEELNSQNDHINGQNITELLTNLDTY